MDSLLNLLRSNARLTASELAVMLGVSEGEVNAKIEEYESKGIIKGYTAIFDENEIDPDTVTALIELTVTPQSQSGFDEIAMEIANYEQVDSVFLMSGTYDIIVSVKGRNIRDVSHFVSERLAAIDAVTATTTHFRLKAYKDNGIIIKSDDADERGLVSP